MLELLNISIVLIVMIILVARKVNLSLVLLISLILTGLLFGRSFLIVYDFFDALKSFETWNLLIMFFLVFLLSELLTNTGILKSMLGSIENMIKDVRLVIISIPSIIGLVPAPSGAMLSAPFVEHIGKKIQLKSERKLIINYWFRHISEYLNPIYPGPILAITLVGISFQKLIVLNLPVTIFVFILGFILYVHGLHAKNNTKVFWKKDLLNIWAGLWPIFFAILLAVVFNINLSIALLASVVLVLITKRVNLITIKSSLLASIKPGIFILLYLVMVFRIVLEKSYATEKVSASLMSLGIPNIILIILIPALIGFLTGMTIAYVGLGFPLLMPFFGSTPDLGLIMLAYVCGYLGIMVSPTHLCLSVTKHYFNCEYPTIYKLLIPGIVGVFLFTLLLYFIGWPFNLI